MPTRESSTTPRRIAVVGGGILGMVTALRLAQQGHRPSVLEAGPSLGGLASSVPMGGFTWDRFYHVILMSDSRLRGLLVELGLRDRLRWSRTRSGFFAQGRLHELSTALDFLRFPPIGPVDKARLALTILRAASIRDGRALERETALEWLTRWSGRRVVERLWKPLLRAKLGANSERVSASFIWAIIARMYAARNTETKREMFGFVEGGYSTILSALEARLRTYGVEVALNTKLGEIQRADDGRSVVVRANDGSTSHFDATILTVPCPVIARLCPTLSENERRRLESVLYQGIICASFLSEKPLSNCYITSLADGSLPFTAVIEMTALVGRESFGGHSLIYLPRYVDQTDSTWDSSDETIRESFLGSLSRVHPDFDPGHVTAFRVSRARHVLALSTLGYSRDVMPDWKTSIPGVYVANSAQIANGTLNVDETLGVVERQLPPILRDLERPGFPTRD